MLVVMGISFCYWSFAKMTSWFYQPVMHAAARPFALCISAFLRHCRNEYLKSFFVLVMFLYMSPVLGLSQFTHSREKAPTWLARLWLARRKSTNCAFSTWLLFLRDYVFLLSCFFYVLFRFFYGAFSTWLARRKSTEVISTFDNVRQPDEIQSLHTRSLIAILDWKRILL